MKGIRWVLCFIEYPEIILLVLCFVFKFRWVLFVLFQSLQLSCLSMTYLSLAWLIFGTKTTVLFWLLFYSPDCGLFPGGTGRIWSWSSMVHYTCCSQSDMSRWPLSYAMWTVCLQFLLHPSPNAKRGSKNSIGIHLSEVGTKLTDQTDITEQYVPRNISRK